MSTPLSSAISGHRAYIAAIRSSDKTSIANPLMPCPVQASGSFYFTSLSKIETPPEGGVSVMRHPARAPSIHHAQA
jgi:hypothetical protein